MTDRGPLSYTATLPDVGVSFLLRAVYPSSELPALGGILLRSENGTLVAESSDTFRVHRLLLPVAGPARSALVPQAMLAAAAAHDVDSLVVEISGSAVTVALDAEAFAGDVIEADFPDTQRLERHAPSAAVLIDDLALALAALPDQTAGGADVLRMSPTAAGVHCELLHARVSRTGAPGPYSTTGCADLSTAWSGDLPAPVDLDAHYLADFVNHAKRAAPGTRARVSVDDRVVSLVADSTDWSLQALISPRRPS